MNVDSDIGPDVPELVPARMVNEFSYCPRLFFLEWVQARFAESADTVEGRWQHRWSMRRAVGHHSPAQVS